MGATRGEKFEEKDLNPAIDVNSHRTVGNQGGILIKLIEK